MQGSLLRWYARHRRDLPWRRDKDPYHILVSEFMLQQTRVETVLPYFERFLKRFPTLPALARAPLHNVLKAWAGLGYYARARHLHSAAKIIRDDHGGKVPSTKKSLLSLPGFGPYTAGAVASLAFSQPVAALDGNVNRLLARLLNLRERTSTGSLKRTLERSVEDLIPPNRASDFNQALMDLGALICVPGRPRCPLCPIKRFCPSRGVQDQESQRKRRKLRKEVWAVALVERDDAFPADAAGAHRPGFPGHGKTEREMSKSWSKFPAMNMTPILKTFRISNFVHWNFFRASDFEFRI